MSASLPRIPTSFAPQEDADSVRLLVRGDRPPTEGEVRGSMAKEAVVAVGLALLVGLFPNDDGGSGPMWSLLRDGPTSRNVGPLLFVCGLFAVFTAYYAYHHRPLRKDAVPWVITATTLSIGPRELRWHEVASIADRGGVLELRTRTGEVVNAPAQSHLEADRDRLVDRVRRHIGLAAADERERAAMHAAAEDLAGRR
ncbi:MAG: hypothetical protein EP330_17140 [Deltaproteobacteria bacterium]|nr:MAG: hypothetical protein EP330_17140 [Deltaproteobacteria bacterium]